MLKSVFVAIVLAVSLSGPVLAQSLTAEQRAACQGDYDKFCKGTMPGGGRIIACLDKQHDQLADGCKKVVDATKK